MNSSDVYLVQTDTTVGFLSADDKKLSLIKQRDEKQKTLQVVDSFKTLKQFVRVPKQYRRRVRRSKTKTFIYPNNIGFRVIDKDTNHQNFIKKFGCLYSTSANITKGNFDISFAVENSDIVIYQKDGFLETNPSSIYKVYKKKLKRLR
ncbi:MAG: Sua5 YciO YrdC YwlC family protein [Campylobacterota bacterium]|nr:Sua5 YciO YrdC YwlC family protein [Campylobacterota bacterium]